ncbi:MAG: hypothetical protein ACRYHC_08645 [Janthinobacterium lividum]
MNLTSLAAIARDPSFVAKVLIAAVPLGGALGAAFTSLWSAGRTTYVNTITAERTKALSELRRDLAEFSTALSTLALDRRLRSDAAKKAGGAEAVLTFDQITGSFEKFERMENTIRLRLTPGRQVDRIITLIMAECGISIVDDLTLTSKMNRLFCLHSQWLIREEWESIKWEAGGIVYKLLHCLQANARSRAYQKFLKGEGEFVISMSVALVKKYTRLQGLDWGSDEEYDTLEKRLKPEVKPSWLQRTLTKARKRQIERRLAETDTILKPDLPRA